MSWACDTRQDAAPEWLATNTTPNWRCWFEAEPVGKEKATASPRVLPFALELAGLGMQKAFGKRFREHSSSPCSLSTRQWKPISSTLPEALDVEGAAHSQHWRLHLPTLEASVAQSSPGRALCSV